MAVKANLLIETEISKAGDVTRDIPKVEGVKSADIATVATVL